MNAFTQEMEEDRMNLKMSRSSFRQYGFLDGIFDNLSANVIIIVIDLEKTMLQSS